jgi:hypothetical protein
MAPKVSIIILNWNGFKDTLECLESLGKLEYASFDIIVVDNGSRDQSVEILEGYLRKIEEGQIAREKAAVHRFLSLERNELQSVSLKEFSQADRSLFLIKNEKNYGFAEGNNIAIRFALRLNPDFILLLNNDTVADSGLLRELVGVAESSPDIGMVGPKILYYDYLGRKDILNSAGGYFDRRKGIDRTLGFREEDWGQYDALREVDIVEGSCMLIPWRVLSEIGLFDPDYFAYWEDTDLCFRVRAKGYRLIFAPRARLWHKVSAASKGVLGGTSVYFNTRNNLLFMSKHSRGNNLLFFLFYFTYFRSWTKFLSYAIKYKNMKAAITYMRGIRDGLKYFK